MNLNFRKSFWVNSIFFTLLQRFSIIFFGLVGYLILVRFFSKEEMGTWALFLTITSLVESIKLGLLRNALIKFIHLPEFADNKQEVQSASIVINVVFSVIVILLIIFVGKGFSGYLKTPALQPLLYLSIVLVILQIPFNHCEIVQQSNMRYSPVFWAYFLRQGLYFMGIFVFIIFFRKEITFFNLVLLQIAALLVATVYSLWAAKKILFRKFAYHPSVLLRLLHFGKYVFGTSLFSTLSRYTDHFITANAIGNADLGKTYVSYYNAVSRVYNLMDVPSTAAADVMFPKNAQAIEMEGNEKVRYYFERMGGTLVALVLPMTLFIFIFPKFIIWVIAGKQYMEAVPILQVTILFSITRPFVNQFGITMDSIGKPQINFWVNTFLLCFNIGMTYLGLHEFGMLGAAYGTAVTAIVSFFLIYAVLRKTLGVHVRHILIYTGRAYKDAFFFIKKMLSKNEPGSNVAG